jgi:hypothetical protein
MTPHHQDGRTANPARVSESVPCSRGSDPMAKGTMNRAALARENAFYEFRIGRLAIWWSKTTQNGSLKTNSSAAFVTSIL